MTVSLADLHHRKVLDTDGQTIGEVEAVLFDPASWRVVLLRVRLRLEAAERAGAHIPMFGSAHIDVPTSMVQGVGDVVLLSVPVAALHGVSRDQTANP